MAIIASCHVVPWRQKSIVVGIKCTDNNRLSLTNQPTIQLTITDPAWPTNALQCAITDLAWPTDKQTMTNRPSEAWIRHNEHSYTSSISKYKLRRSGTTSWGSLGEADLCKVIGFCKAIQRTVNVIRFHLDAEHKFDALVITGSSSHSLQSLLTCTPRFHTNWSSSFCIFTCAWHFLCFFPMEIRLLKNLFFYKVRQQLFVSGYVLVVCL